MLLTSKEMTSILGMRLVMYSTIVKKGKDKGSGSDSSEQVLSFIS